MTGRERMKSIGKVLALALASWLLAACQSSGSGSNTTSSTPSNSCYRNSYGQYTCNNSYGGYNSQNCVQTPQGYAINQQTGQPCTTGSGYGSGYGAGYGGGNGAGYGSDPCAYATQMYGQQYYYQNGVCINPYGS